MIEDTSTYLFPYQKAWLNDHSRYKIWEKSRRIGATYVQSLEDVKDCLEQPNLPVWFSSADESAAKEYINYCANWALMFNAVASAVATEVIDEKQSINAYSISFKNGSRIHAMSSNPKGFRSKGGKVVLDEFAWHKDQQALWTAAEPVITWGHNLRILSTHNGKQSLFYNFIQDVEKGILSWSKHRTPIQEAVRQGLADRIAGNKLSEQERFEWLEQKRRNCRTEEAWLQEYCCEPIDESSAFLTLEMLLACERPETEIILPTAAIRNNIYIGFDVARRKDLSVIYIAELLGETLITRNIVVLKNMSFSKQKELLFNLLRHSLVRRCCIDASGLGMNLAEDAQATYGHYKVEAVTFTNAVKEELATDLRIRFEDRSILIPANEDLRNDLHSIKRVITTAGNTRYDVSQTETDGHADRFWALALCCHAAKGMGGYVPKVTFIHSREAPGILRGY